MRYPKILEYQGRFLWLVFFLQFRTIFSVLLFGTVCDQQGLDSILNFVILLRIKIKIQTPYFLGQ